MRWRGGLRRARMCPRLPTTDELKLAAPARWLTAAPTRGPLSRGFEARGGAPWR